MEWSGGRYSIRRWPREEVLHRIRTHFCSKFKNWNTQFYNPHFTFPFNRIDRPFSKSFLLTTYHLSRSHWAQSTDFVIQLRLILLQWRIRDGAVVVVVCAFVESQAQTKSVHIRVNCVHERSLSARSGSNVRQKKNSSIESALLQ